MLTICNYSTGQNIGLYGAGYLSFNEKYESGTGAGLYFHDYLKGDFDLGIDIHLLKHTEDNEKSIAYCGGEPCNTGGAIRVSESTLNADSTATFSSKLTYYTWKISMEPTWQVIKKEKPFSFSLGLDLGIGKVGKREVYESYRGKQKNDRNEFNISTGLNAIAYYHNFPAKRLNLFFKFNPEFHLTRKDPNNIQDASPFMTQNLWTLQAKFGISYSLNDS